MLSAGETGQLVAAGAAVVALFYGGEQLRQNRRLASRQLVYSYLDRLSDPDFQAVLAASRSFWLLAPGDDENARWEEWVAKSLEDKHKLVLPMNLFEEMGAMYNQGLLDDGVVRRVMASTILAYWQEAFWLIARYRSSEPKALYEWELMKKTLQRPKVSWLGL